MASRVVVHSRFREMDAEIEQACRAVLNDAAKVANAAAQGKPDRGYQIDAIVADTGTTPVTRGRWGLEMSLYWRDFRSVFFNRGTYQRRSGKLKRPRRGTRGNVGVWPIRFAKAGRDAAQAYLIPALRKELNL